MSSKCAIVAIAKNEDHYLDEWISYHLSIGFSDIFVYMNDWKFESTYIKNENVHFIEFNGSEMQLKAYNNFLKTNKRKFDFAAFIDIDEFICTLDINRLLSQFSEYKGLALNWKIFGDSNYKTVIDNDYRVIDRFTWSQRYFDPHTKLILNLSKISNERFVHPHYINDMSNIVNVIKQPVFKDKTPIPRSYNPSTYLAHYRLKTRQEFLEKKSRGWPTKEGLGISEWHWHNYNLNSIENLDVLKIKYHTSR